MRIWLPYIRGGSGADVFTRNLARGLRARGYDARATCFANFWEYFSFCLKLVPPPAKTDVILANAANAFAFKRANIPLIAVEHLFVLDPAFAPYKNSLVAFAHAVLLRKYTRAGNRAACATVAVSRHTARAYHDVIAGTAPEVISNAIDTGFFCPADAAPAKSAGSPTRLLYVGNLSKRKESDLLPAILERLGPGFELSYTSGLRTPDMLKGVPHCHSLGRLDQNGVREAYRSADILVFPSRLEGLSLTIMEAMACGLPVIANNYSSMPELIEHGVTRLLVPQDDADAFAKAITSLSADSEKRRAISIKARERATRDFSLDRMLDEYIALFDEVTAAKPKARLRNLRQDQPAI